MNIAFYNLLGEMRNAEEETLMRLKYCFNKQGHELFILDKNGFVIRNENFNGKRVEDLNIDFLFTFNYIELGVKAFPDIYSVLLHWSPIGFCANFQSLLGIKYFNTFDSFASTYEQNLFNSVDKINIQPVSFMGASVPLDFCLPPRKHSDRRLFYIGINFERKLMKMRYEEFLKKLDMTNKLDIYGPTEVYGVKDLWSGFKSYKGEIPFDGKSILKKINQAGICLAINSPMHNSVGGVSSRTYEAAAGGALIISDDNAFVRKYFKDSVFYVDVNESEKESAKKIIDIVNWANSHPEESYQMAKASSEIFKKELSLDSMVKNFIYGTNYQMKYIQDIANQHECVDIICFIESLQDFDAIHFQIMRQYYKNVRIIIVDDGELEKEICQKYRNNDFVFVKGEGKENKGASFINVIPHIKSNYFMFIDAFSIMHKRHIHKNIDIIMNYDTLFVYSGCYIKTEYGYININNEPILRDEFLYFSSASYVDWLSRDAQCLFVETIFSRCAALFKREILNIVDNIELNFISNNIHYYLACCSMIKKNMLGRFTYALTTGYTGSSIEEINNTVFKHRKQWYLHGRSDKTYLKEMNEIFFKYTFETTPNFVMSRIFTGVPTHWSDLAHHTESAPKQNEFVFSDNEIHMLLYIKKNKFAYKLAKIITKHKINKYPNEDIRFVLYCRKHHLVRNFFRHFAKKYR